MQMYLLQTSIIRTGQLTGLTIFQREEQKEQEQVLLLGLLKVRRSDFS